MSRLSNVTGSVVLWLLVSFCFIAPAFAAAPVIDLSTGSSTKGGSGKPTTIDGRLSRLERLLENQTLVDMTLRLESMQQEMQRMFGELEVMSHDINKLKQRQRELYLDIDRRFQKLESQDTGLSSSGTAPSSGSSAGGQGDLANDQQIATLNAGTEPDVLDDEQRQKAAYQAAFNLLRKGKYDMAKSGFTEFVKTHPKSDYADNAQYWLGEVNYVQRNFENALAEFNKVLTIYPDSSKASDAMLKIGLSHYEMENWEKASSTFNQIVKKYPNTSAAQLAEKRLKTITLRKN